METTNIQSFSTPECKVQFSNIVVDHIKKTFSCTVGTKEKGKRKFINKEVSGTITMELANWLSAFTPEKVKVAADNPEGFIMQKTGRNLTGFHRYLAKQGIEFHPGILKDMTFTADNTSPDYASCPFKLAMLSQRNILSLVNVATRKRIETFDPNSGKVNVRYEQRYGNIKGHVVRAFVAPQFYRRLVVEVSTPVQVVQ